jgi:hypothetical protein
MWANVVLAAPALASAAMLLPVMVVGAQVLLITMLSGVGPTSVTTGTQSAPHPVVLVRPTHETTPPSDQRGEVSKLVSEGKTVRVRQGEVERVVRVRVPVRLPGSGGGADVAPGVNDDGSHLENGDVKGYVAEQVDCLTHPVVTPERIGCREDPDASRGG